MNLPVDGIHCAGCVARVEAALNNVPGVRAASVNLATGEAQVSFDTSEATLHDLLGAVDGAGYRVPVGVTELSIQGMHCAACVSRVEKVMAKAPGVLEAEVSLATESARLQFIPGVLDRGALAAMMEEGGYALREDQGEGFEEA